MSKPIHRFYEETKNTQIQLSIALIGILIFMVAPLNISFGVAIIGKMFIVLLLAYALFRNFTETRRLSLAKHTKQTSSEELKDNIILSYGLCAGLLILLLYVVYSCL
jgi:prolipoprotein diacylglyceryltransferase